MKYNKILFSTLMTALMFAVLCGCGKSKKVIPVNQIDIQPNPIDLCVGQSVSVTVKTAPEDATNVGEMTVNISKPEIATLADGKVTGVSVGNANLTAICGTVRKDVKVNVYHTMKKNGVAYPVTKASGYKMYMGTSTVDYYDIDFTDGTEHIRIMLSAEMLGKTIDVSKPVTDLPDGGTCNITVCRNQNENFYSLWMGKYGDPYIVDNLWNFITATPTGTFSLSTGPKGFKAVVNVSLSNGQKWELEYEGIVVLKDEGMA
ncbi:MAG: Ig-like domain-containing protein [Bacteroidales bacterium]|nr:Ig-like domain-containing protein [Bacteroidales bacterium]